VRDVTLIFAPNFDAKRVEQCAQVVRPELLVGIQKSTDARLRDA
jgi:hypothetical protein